MLIFDDALAIALWCGQKMVLAAVPASAAGGHSCMGHQRDRRLALQHNSANDKSVILSCLLAAAARPLVKVLP
jgi:hypothetical protein